MTSQIILGNFEGIVVASDTASTYTRTGAVTHDNHKIIDLGPDHKVLISLAASTWQDGQPQSATIRQWRNSLVEPLVRIEDYAESFYEWHQRAQVNVSREQSSDNIVGSLLDHSAFLRSRVERSGALSDEEGDWLEGMEDYAVGETIREIFEDGFEWLSGLPNYASISDGDAVEMLAEYEIDLDWIVNREFPGWPLTDEHRQILHRSWPLVISRAQYMPKGSTDLHFVGFGAKDTEPGFVEILNRGTIGNRPMQRIAPVRRIGPGENETRFILKPIAQDSAIEAFIRGIEINMLSSVRHSFDSEMTDALIQKFGSLNFDTAWNRVETRIHGLSRENFMQPFYDTLVGATLDRLAQIARTLIELQKIRSETESNVNSVGGEVDVVKITVDRGVEWIRGRALN